MDSISFHLDVISGVGKLYSGSVKSVRVTGSEGELGIRYGHTPLLTTKRPRAGDIALAQHLPVTLYISHS